MKDKMKNEKGFSLTSLVITIIVLIIMSGIAIKSGQDTLRYSKYNKAKSEIEFVQSVVNSWNQEYNNGNENALTYGISVSSSECDQKIAQDTFENAGITENTSDYRYLSHEYIKSNLNLDADYDFLVNVKNRDVILFDGIIYDGKTYYTTKDFKIKNITENFNIKNISFSLQKRRGKNIIITDLKFLNEDNGIENIGKFIVRCSPSDENWWTDVTGQLKKITYKGKDAYEFTQDGTGEFKIKISTTDGKVVSGEKTIKVGDVLYEDENINLTGNNYITLNGENGFPSVNLFFEENKDNDFTVKFKFNVDEGVKNANNATLISAKLEAPNETVYPGFAFRYSTDGGGKYVLTVTADKREENRIISFARNEVEGKDIQIIKEDQILYYKIGDAERVAVMDMTNTPSFDTYMTIGAISDGTRKFIGNVEYIEVSVNEKPHMVVKKTRRTLYEANNLVFDGTNNIILNGQNNLPEVRLFNEENFNKDFEIEFVISELSANLVNAQQDTIMNSKLEDSSKGYPGFVARRKNVNQIEIKGKQNAKVTPQNSEILNKTILLTRESGKLYCKVGDGNKVEMESTSGYGYFDTPLTIGSSIQTNNTTMMRPFKGKISYIKISIFDVEYVEE